MITREDIIHYLSGAADEELFALSSHAKQSTVGQKVYLRGLVELSNRCDKNCYYCGIRHANLSVERYTLLAQDVLQAAQYALSQGYGSLVLQAGERRDEHFIAFVEELLHSISQLGDRALGVTLSLGEQSAATFARWRNAGAKRYLLRMESFNRELYATLHPAGHSWSQRRACLDLLREADYQVGTGVMIGLPGQSLGDLADDLLSMVALDIDMCGMGPYVEHSAAPLSVHASPYAVKERVRLTLRMVALLRILMPSINIAATTALDALDCGARGRCLAVGANVLMPNISPQAVRGSYMLYDNKPQQDMDLVGLNIAYNEQGDSLHYSMRRG